jgi:hypothetical protein
MGLRARNTPNLTVFVECLAHALNAQKKRYGLTAPQTKSARGNREKKML